MRERLAAAAMMLVLEADAPTTVTDAANRRIMADFLGVNSTVSWEDGNDQGAELAD